LEIKSTKQAVKFARTLKKESTGSCIIIFDRRCQLCRRCFA